MKSSLFFLHSDARILDLMKKGDDDALVKLFDSNKRMVVTYILRNHGTEDDADDMLQEAIITLWQNVRSGKFDSTSRLSTYIYAVVQNMWRRKLARTKREIVSDIDMSEKVDEEISILDSIIEDEQTEKIALALRKLGEPCRTLLLLYYWEECSMDEIARQLKFANAETAKSKKYQCKKSLEIILDDERIF